MHRWTQKETELLIKMYTEMKSIDEIAEQFKNRTRKSIINKANKLKITNRRVFTNEEDEYIIENYKSYNLKEISEKLGRSKTTVCRRAKQLNVSLCKKKKEKTKTFKDEKGVYHYNGWVRKDCDSINKKKSEIMKEWHKNNEHPKGMSGKKHTKKYAMEIQKRVLKYWSEITNEELEERRMKQRKTRIKNGTLNPNAKKGIPYSRCRGGKRNDLNNIYFRSSWEANYARFLNFMKVKWEYEPKTFIFENIKRGSVSYTPDFYLPDEDKWVEIKGWMDAKSKTKLKRFEKYFPEEYKKLELIQSKEYNAIKDYARLIPNWEY